MTNRLRWSAGAVAVAGMLAFGSARAEAVTLREIIELTRAGLDDEVLLALIEVDQRVFPIDVETLKTLKDAGVSPRVIVAIVKSGRDPQSRREPLIAEQLAPEPPPPPAAFEAQSTSPHVVVVERTVVHEVPVAVPVYVAVGGYQRSRHRAHQPDHHRVETRTYTPSIGLGPPVVDVEVRKTHHEKKDDKKAEPVYWGFGGKLRPDSWAARK